MLVHNFTAIHKNFTSTFGADLRAQTQARLTSGTGKRLINRRMRVSLLYLLRMRDSLRAGTQMGLRHAQLPPSDYFPQIN